MRNKIPKDAHVMIIGAMKAGTSSLYDYLLEHPAICPAVTKEPEFFSEHQGHGVEAADYGRRLLVHLRSALDATARAPFRRAILYSAGWSETSANEPRSTALSSLAISTGGGLF